MLAVAVDLASPFIWAGAVAVVGGIVWLLTTATKAGIGDVVEGKLDPLHKTLEKQVEMIEGIEKGLDDQQRRMDREHGRIWDAIDDLRRRAHP